MAEEKAASTDYKKQNRILIIIIVILALFSGAMSWQYFELRKQNAEKGSEIEVMSDERKELESELEDMLTEIDSLETDNDSIRMELNNQRAEIEDLLKNVRNKDWTIYKLKKETKTLRTIMKGYVVTIDSLNTLNVGLRKENEQVRTTLRKERGVMEELRKTNEGLESTVELASRLEASSIRSFGVHVKKDLTGKETDRAKRTDKIRACFTIDENKVAEAGKRNLYLRIIAPDGKILAAGTTDEYRFTFDGLKGLYSDKMNIQYDNAAKEYCLDWQRPSEDYNFIAGVYQIMLYAENYEIGSSSLTLR